MASWVEMFHIPMREIEKQFTRSELMLIAWRSQESFQAMRKKFKNPTAEAGQRVPFKLKQPTPEDYGVPKELLSEKLEMDIRKLTSKDLTQYIMAQEKQRVYEEDDF